MGTIHSLSDENDSDPPSASVPSSGNGFSLWSVSFGFNGHLCFLSKSLTYVPFTFHPSHSFCQSSTAFTCSATIAFYSASTVAHAAASASQPDFLSFPATLALRRPHCLCVLCCAFPQLYLQQMTGQSSGWNKWRSQFVQGLSTTSLRRIYCYLGKYHDWDLAKSMTDILEGK